MKLGLSLPGAFRLPGRFGQILLLCGCLAATALALDPRKAIAEYAVEDKDSNTGLPHDSVRAIAQDKVGWMWFSTERGLARYDGVKFDIFSSSNTPALKVDRMESLYASSDGSMWMGGYDGSIVQYRDGQFTPHGIAQRPGIEQTEADMSVIGFLEETPERFWVATISSVFLLSTNDQLTLVPGLPSRIRPIPDICRDVDGSIWIGTRSQGVFNLRGGEVHHYSPDSHNIGTNLCHIASDPKGGIWLVHRDTTLQLLRNGRLIPIPNHTMTPLEQAETAIMDHLGVLWLATSGKTIRRFTDGREIPDEETYPVSEDSFTSIYEDHEGSVWLGSQHAGLRAYKDSNIALLNTRLDLGDTGIRCLLQTREGALWMGVNDGGVGSFKNGHLSRVNGTETLPQDKTVMALTQFHNGDIGIGLRDGGFYIYHDGQAHRFAPPNIPYPKSVRAIMESRDHSIWVGDSTRGLFQLTGKNGAWDARIYDMGGKEVRYLHEATDGTIWITLHEGGLRWLKTDGEVVNPLTAPGQTNLYGRMIHEDAKGVIWVALHNGGLLRYKDNHFAHIPFGRDLPDGTVHHILEDSAGNFWLSSDQSVIRVQKKDLDNVADGISSSFPFVDLSDESPIRPSGCNGGSQAAGCYGLDGRLWFAARRGALMIDAGHWETNTPTPPAFIKEVVADGITNIAAGTLRFPPNRGDLEFHYTAFSFINAAHLRFQHQLEGVDPHWVDAGTRREVRYPGVSPGLRRFKVRAAAARGEWSAPVFVTFYLAPHYYQTTWFITSMILLGIGLILGFHLYRLSVQRRMMGLQQANALERERSRIAQDIHDDLGASLTHISFLSELAERHQDRLIISNHVKKIHGTARELLRSLDEIVWATNPKNDTLESLVNYIGFFAQDYLSATPLACRLDVPTDVPAWRLSAETRHNIFLAVKEAVHNAVKYSGGKEVRIELSLEPQAFRLRVRDDGKGFDPATVSGEGNGLINMRKRLMDINGTLTMDSAPGRGSTIEFRVPKPVGR